jgi:Spy/CpxP family protein refolding chaperone
MARNCIGAVRIPAARPQLRAASFVLKDGRMQTAKFLIGIAAMLAVGSSAIAATKAAAPGHDRHHHTIASKLRDIGATDAQRKQIKAVLRDVRPTIRTAAKEYRQERRALRRTIRANPSDEAAIRAKSERVAQLKSELRTTRAQLSKRIHRILTPEQRGKLRALRAKGHRRTAKSSAPQLIEAATTLPVAPRPI